jgi:hypothetical protein
MDTGFTEHSGCPVYVGEKKIVTQWIRLGVDDNNPWDSFNTLGVKKSELDADGNLKTDDEDDEEGWEEIEYDEEDDEEFDDEEYDDEDEGDDIGVKAQAGIHQSGDEF